MAYFVAHVTLLAAVKRYTSTIMPLWYLALGVCVDAMLKHRQPDLRTKSPVGAVLTRLKAMYPSLGAILFFLALIACVQPWSNLPLQDDWVYAHIAKIFAEQGTFGLDVSAAAAVGQSLIAWPIIQIFGFSHVALRLLTIALSCLILVQLDYLLLLSAVPAGIRFITLCALVANPIFIHLATTFMTENYGYFVALLAACVWFHGRKRASLGWGVVAAAIAGFAFWIRQFCAIVFPALLLAEWLVDGASVKGFLAVARKRAPAIVVWIAFIAVYFPWAKATGNYTSQFSARVSQLFAPDPIAIVVELGIYLFYVTFFFSPFLIGYGLLRKPSISGWTTVFALSVTAVFAWVAGLRSGPPSVQLNSVFPFLNDVFTNFGIGPITFTDFYWDNVKTRPRTPELLWLVLEITTVIVSFAWVSFARRAQQQRNEIGLFGICFAALAFVSVALTYKYAVLDRYHFPGILGLSLSLAIFLPSDNRRRFYVAGVVWIAGMTAYSTLSLHDYFRWQEAREALLTTAQQHGISLSMIDAGFEPNAWYTLEGRETPCGQKIVSCRSRPYHIGLEQLRSDSLVFSRRIDAWFVRFPEVKLLKSAQ